MSLIQVESMYRKIFRIDKHLYNLAIRTEWSHYLKIFDIIQPFHALFIASCRLDTSCEILSEVKGWSAVQECIYTLPEHQFFRLDCIPSIGFNGTMYFIH